MTPRWLELLLVLLLLVQVLCQAQDGTVEFTKSSYNATIPENSVGKTYVQPTERMGIELTDANLEVRYKIVSGDKDRLFRAESRKVGDFWFLFLRTRAENSAVLNREYEDQYKIKIRASISHKQRVRVKLKARCDVVVTVLDRNDLNPLFYPTSYNITLPEGTPLHRSVLKVSAYDPDLGINGEIYYSLLEPSRQFSIHPTMGTLTLTRPLDYQTKSSYDLTVVAQDRGPKLRSGDIIKSSTAKVYISVRPENKYNPEVFVRHLQTIFDPGLPEVWAVVKVTDKDYGIHGQIAGLEIVDGDVDGHFKVVPGSKTGEYNMEVEPRLGKPMNPYGYTLTLRAWDAGTPSRYTDQVVRFQVTDMGNLVPVFNRSEYDIDVDEVAPPGTPLLFVRAQIWGSDSSSYLSYRIDNGDEDSTFSINPESGLISTRRKLDREQRRYYSLTVSASNSAARGQRKKTTTIVNINVVDCNDNPPIFNQTAVTVQFDENRPAGSKVYTVHAEDKDESDNGYVSYSLVNLNPVPFSVDPFTGDVRTTEVLDFETMRRDYILRIRATDWGTPFQRQAEMTLRIRLKDVNDHRPQFEKVDCIASVSRKATPGLEILTLSAIDFDEGSMGMVTYLMDPSSNDPCFRLDAHTGAITLACSLQEHMFYDRLLNVTATDGQHFADVMTIKVRVVNRASHQLGNRDARVECKDVGVTEKLKEQLRTAERNNQRGVEEDEVEPTAPSFLENRHSPEFPTDVPREVTVNESIPVGSEIISLAARDLDHGYNGKLVYVISNGNEDSCFKMDMYSGDLLLLSQLDREKNDKYVLNITAYDLGQPPRHASRTLLVHVDDVNDNPPIFEKSSYNFVIAEDATNGTSIARLRATDKDIGVNAEIRFSLATDTNDFYLHPSTGLLTVHGKLDRERQETYELTVKVTDAAPLMPLTSTATVQIRLLDVNDNPPKFTLTQYLARIREDLPVGSVVMSMSARDPDSGDGGKVFYEIISEHGNVFDVDPEMGAIRLMRELDFEQRQIYNVTVKASDRGSPSLSAVSYLLVEVEDVNENLYPPKFSDLIAEASVKENQPKGTLVTTVTATDDDNFGLDGTIAYSIIDGSGMGIFSIDSQGNVRTRAILDCETLDHYWLTIVAQDRASVPFTARLYMYINVLDENDNVPLTQEPAYYLSVPENSPSNLTVLAITAFDLDNNRNQTITYRITGGDPQGFFIMDQYRGVLSTTPRRLDRESQSKHILEVTVSDNGEPPLSSTTQVIVTVQDENDNEPVFLYTPYRFSVPEMEEENEEKELCQVLASDKDDGPNGEVVYKLTEGSPRFSINPVTGVLYTRYALVPGEHHDIQVEAFDQGSPSSSATTKVLLSVVARPEISKHPPTINDVEIIHIIENDKIGAMVAIVKASDLDGDKLWYSITEGNKEGKFTISKESGLIWIGKHLDRETTSVYNITIEVTDGIYSASRNVGIKLLDANDHWPEFSEGNFKAEISENIPEGTDVLQLTGIDRDMDKRLFYAIHNSASPNSLKKFRVDSSTGILSIAEMLDHEEARKHILTVVVKDAGTPANRGFARVTIHVMDHNDHAPEFLSTMFEGQVFETAAVGTSVVQIHAVDRDKGHNARMSYSMVSGNVGGTFNIDTELGIISVAKELSQQTLPEYFLVIRAVDHGEPSLNSTVTVHITVTVADNAPPKFEHPETIVETYENEKVGTFVVAMEANSRTSLYYEIASGNTDDSFMINPTSGIISTNKVLDYEKTKFYNLTISATSMVGTNGSTTLIVHILDRNDNAPHFLHSEYVGYISEASEIGSVVLTNESSPLVVKATDEDSELNSLLTFEIVDKWVKKFFKIDPSTGSLSIIQQLDREITPKYEFRVQVSDTGKPKLSSRLPAHIVVHVTDVNDSPPRFDYQFYNASLILPTYSGVTVATVHATDPDLDSPSGIKYMLVTGDHENKFEVDPVSGQVRVQIPDDLQDLYRLVISASDGEYETATIVIVSVSRSHDSTLKFGKDLYETFIMENTTEVKNVTIVTVIGSALNEHIKFSILNPSEMFEIGETSGIIKTKGLPFDREITNSYRLVVEARSDSVYPPNVAHVLVDVSVIDINDNAPIFVNLPYYSVIPVDAKEGDLVRKVEAIDLDLGENGHVKYQFLEGDLETFHIDSENGRITLKQPLSTHNTEYELTVVAYDNGLPPLKATAVVPIKVVNRAMPVFPQQFYAVSIPENQPSHVPVLTIKADSPKGRQLIYSIVSGNTNEDFGVDFNTDPDHSNGPCVLYVVEQLDFETIQKYQLTIRATDSVTGAYADVLVGITVDDVNDFAPMFTQPAYNTSVSEAAPFGTSILKVHASDRDTGKNQKVQYSILGKELAYFYVEADEGIVFIKQSLDHETQPMYHFIVMAADGGTPSLSSTAHVWVNVIDMNDNPPVFENPTYTCMISELAQRGQFLTRVVASDPDVSDMNKLTYSIVGGNEMQAFTIDKKTGIITLSNLHQFAQQSAYFLNVSVTDGVYQSHAKVRVTVLPSNQHSPVFTHTVYEAAVAENLPRGSIVTTVTATDQDRGDYGKISYSIRSDLYAKEFQIDPATGEVSTSVSLDREKRYLYEIPVVAVDKGGRLSYTIVRVTVTDVNDNDPHFVASEYKANIHANTTIGTAILQVRAFDKDQGPAATLHYSIHDAGSNNVSSLFGITHDLGQIYLKASLRGRENSAFHFFIRVRDRGSPVRENIVPVEIVVMNTNEAVPHLEHQFLEFFLDEGAPIGTVVFTLNVTYTGPLHHSFVPAPKGSGHEIDASKFSIDEHGRILLMSKLDREQQAIYYLTIKVETTSTPSLISFMDVTINVMDDNDNKPKFDTENYHISVAENIEDGARLVKLTAFDDDIGLSSKITYEFYEGNDPAADIFQLDPNTGWITSLVPLDREAVPYYNFTIMARDNGLPSHFTTAWVYIEVIDYNDNPPVFHRSHYNAAIYEDSLGGTVIVTLETTDADENRSSVDFYIIKGNSQEQFGIRKTGDLYVNRNLDRELVSSYKLEVVATDGLFVTRTVVDIDVLDANDNPPICLKSKYTELVYENIVTNTVILSVEATDADEKRNAELRYYLSGKGSDDFIINASTGVLRTAKVLNRERQSRYMLTAHVQDWGKKEWECTSIVEILLNDINDNPPTFTQEVYSVSVPEDVEVGTLITKVHATDKDLDLGRKVSYSFLDSSRGHFQIDETSGIVRLNKPLDREERAMYNLTVQARDHGTPQMSSVATLLVLVQDINDNPPEFAQKFYYAVVPEVASIGSEVIKVYATSRDSGVNAEITYFLSAGNEDGSFSINPKTGAVTVAKHLDYESIKEYFLTILARDGGTPALSNQATLNISVTDSNDNPPVFTQTSYNAVIREDALINDKIIRVIASDADSGLNAALSFSILHGDRHSQFKIDSDTGYVSLAASLDREMISNYVLEIECSDSGEPPLSSKVWVNVEVSDVNDNPPAFSQTNYTSIVQEGKPVGFTILKLSVSDPDSLPNAGPFIFDILSGNEDNAFRIVQQDATLRTATKLDHKKKSDYTLHVRVSDSGKPPLTTDTNVLVKIIEESQYPPDITPLNVRVISYLDDFPGGIMGRVHASDKDQYDKLTYDIVSSHQHLFTIDREDGMLMALPGLDVGTYSINVSVSDGKFTRYTNVAMEVALVNEDGLMNSVGIRFDDVTPEDFLLTYKKGFIRVLRTVLSVKTKDVQIISIQPATEDETPRTERSARQDLDVLFAVHKGNHGYYSAKIIRTKLQENTVTMESSLGLQILQITEDRCTSTHCVHGECIDRIMLDRAFAVSVTTDAFSFVSPQHYRQLDCQCNPGFGGSKCEMAVNECARKPCPAHRICVPDSSSLGYSCQCPEGKTGPLCSDIIKCQDPGCYEEKHPISFGGKSYAHYSLSNPMDRRITVAMRVRTIQSSGNLMYSAGARDYSILEVVNGLAQYRFDCGSGEGLVRVEQIRINDAAWHEVLLERRGNFARLSVDQRYESSGSAPGVHDILNLDGNDVFFGAEVRLVGYDDLRMGFVGCLDNIRVDGIVLPLHVSGGSSVANLRRFANVQFHCKTLFDPGVCGSQPCQNGGTCRPAGENFSCICLPRFRGSLCEIDTNPCASNPCLYGGTCKNLNNDYLCECPSRLSGKRCEYGRYCNPNPCQNNGVCEEGTKSHVCKCRGYQGDRCQHDIDECLHGPCAQGSTCLNLPGTFQCICPPNVTGPLCSEHLITTSITSSEMNTTVEELIGITVVVIFIFILAVVVACCWRFRNKRQNQHQDNLVPLDQGVGSEMTVKNSMLGKDNVKRLSKMSNLEVTTLTTPPLPPRPASYTPSMQDTLNNFDTVRSYGSAADDLESRYTTKELRPNLAKPPQVSIPPTLSPPPPSNSASDTDSLRKSNWETEKEKIYEDKIQNDLKTHKALLPQITSVSNTMSAQPSRGPSSTGVNSVTSLNLDDLPGYAWDYSDLAPDQKPLANITEVPGNEIRDSSSMQSADSNSQNSQIDLLPAQEITKPLKSANGHPKIEMSDFDLPESYVGDSENNESEDGLDGPYQPNFEDILQISDAEYADDGNESSPSSPLRYQRHPNQYLPTHSLSNDHSPWSEQSNVQNNPCDDMSDEEFISYGFPPQGGRGFMVNSEITRNSGIDCLSMSAGDFASTHASCSDLSGNVCEIDDSEVNSDDDDDTDNTVLRKPITSTVV